MHENQIKSSDKKYPMYINVHVVSVDPVKQTIECSCKKKVSHGYPCVHIYTVAGKGNSKMFHPRWFKHYNSHLFEENVEIKNNLTKIKEWHNLNINKCDITGKNQVII